ncbi:hypothetical protein [Verrucomicrobium spinosum]|uniref:hypothetical protein n=1 Tax=Verrucomicrobium spinosum TaxID=2736 RepID=UPI000B21FB06|nr:hypothetical protein [Verrucomicrobium spinosum]
MAVSQWIRLILSEQTSRFAQPYEVAPDGRKVLRQATARRERSQNYTLQNELSGRVNTGPVRHDLLLGVELSRYQFRYEIGSWKCRPSIFFIPSMMRRFPPRRMIRWMGMEQTLWAFTCRIS